MSFTSSRFNLFYPWDDGVAVFSAATGLWAMFSSAEANSLEQNRLNRLSLAAMKKAMGIGAVIPESRDELEWYRTAYRNIANDRTTATYILMLTYHCNLDCPYCFQGDVRHDQKMSREMCLRVIRAMQQRSEQDNTRRLSIVLFGGEPLLERELCLLVLRTMDQWCEERGIEYQSIMSTNGVLLSQQVVDQLVPYIDWIQLTFDGPRDTHDSLRIGRNKKPTFDRIVKAVRLLVNRGIRVHLRIQIHRSSANRLKDVLQELEEEGILPHPLIYRSVAMVRDQKWCGSCQNFSDYVPPDSEDERRVIELMETWAPSGRPAVQIVPCVMAGNQICIDPKGHVYRCLTDVNDPRWRVGQICEDDTIVFNDAMSEYDRRDPTTWPTCRDCPYLPLCGGGCPSQARHSCGSFQQPSCRDSKLVLDARIKGLIQRQNSISRNAPVSLQRSC